MRNNFEGIIKFGAIVTFVNVLFINSLSAQDIPSDSFRKWKTSVHLFGLTIHTFKTGHPERYDWKLDPGGFLVVTPGIATNLDWYYHRNQKTHFRLSLAWYKDSGLNNAGYAAVNWRHTFFRKKNWEIATGLGPGFFIRENWNRIYPDRKVSDPFYGDRESKNGLYQSRWFPLAGEIDLYLRMKERWEWDIVLVPGAPALFLVKIGARYSW